MRHLTVATAIAALSLVLAVVALARDPALVVSQERADEPAPPLEGGRRVSQSFVAAADGLQYLELRLATYETTPDGNLQVVLHAAPGVDGKVAEWSVPGSEIEDNQWHRLYLPWPDAVEAGSGLELALSRDEPAGRPVTAWTGSGDPYPDGEMHVDGQESGNDMAFRAAYRRGRAEAARARLESTGYGGVLAGALLVAVFALPMAFLYTYRLALSGR